MGRKSWPLEVILRIILVTILRIILQDPTEKHFCDVGILGKYKYEDNNNYIHSSVNC